MVKTLIAEFKEIVKGIIESIKTFVLLLFPMIFVVAILFLLRLIIRWIIY